MRRIKWADKAIADLKAIQTYLDENHTADVSRTVVRQLVVGGRFLLDYPGAGAPLEARPWRKWRPRKSQYLLIYRPVRDGIEIVRVRHERNDWVPIE